MQSTAKGAGGGTDYRQRIQTFCKMARKLAGNLRGARKEERYAAQYARSIEALADWTENLFDFLDKGFTSGQLEQTEKYPAIFAFAQLISTAEDDLSALEKASSQHADYSLSEDDCLCLSEYIFRLATDSGVKNGWLGESWLFSAYEGSLQLRFFAFAPIAILNIPFSYIDNHADLAGVFHESGHFVTAYANIDGQRLQDVMGEQLKTLPPTVGNWFDEAFADGYALRTGGAYTALWFQELLIDTADAPAEQSGLYGFRMDAGRHIPDIIRPFFFCKVLAFEQPIAAQLLWDNWLSLLQSRGGVGDSITTIVDGQITPVRLDELLAPGIEANNAYPLDRLATIVYSLLSDLPPALIVDTQSVRSVDEIRTQFLQAIDALHIQLPFVGNQENIEILDFPDLLERTIPSISKGERVPVDEWRNLIESSGYIVGVRKESRTMSVNWNGQPQASVNWDAQPWQSVNWNGQPQASVNWNGQPPPPTANWNAQPWQSVNWNGQPQASVNWNVQPQPPFAHWNTQQGGQPMYGGMPFQRMSEDGSPKASVSLNSPWRLFLETDVMPGTEWIPYLPKPGKFQHGKYGEVNISSERNANFVKNFNAGVYQTQLPVDAEHNTKESGALGWLNKMRMNADGSADAQVTWNVRGQQMLAEKRFKYVSPEFYEEWTDPATGKKYSDVAIGVALTTRPFFKESHLRPLIATEQGIYTLEPQAQITPPVSPYRYGGRRMEEQPVEGGQANPQAVAELQQRFAELEAAHTETVTHSQKLTEALDRSNRVIAEMQQAAQTRRFTDLVVGEKRWYGEVDTHLKVLRSFAETFGENSDEFTTYVQQQQALAEQVATSQLFAEYGHNKPGQKRTAADELDAKARTFQAEHAGMTYAQAYSEVLSQNPGLYDRYRKEG